ncbi:MAG: 3-isopropylmalate dehydratase small subunit [Pseudomonadota bacterium]
MKPVTQIVGQAVPLDRAHVDTDQIIPKQYLKSIRRTGFGDYLFDGWRFEDEGELGITPNERRLNRAFVLNDPRFQGASLLLARENFGCGSSREHAVWALKEFGFDCVIAPSFADIFYNNCFKNGLLAVALPAETVDALFRAVLANPDLVLTVDLEHQTVRAGDEPMSSFDVEPVRREKLLRGLDDIEMTLEQRHLIEQFETDYRRRAPWLFPEAGAAS